MTEHCCVHLHCIDSQEAVSLRYRLTCLTRERFEGKNGAPSGSDLENILLTYDRLEAVRGKMPRSTDAWLAELVKHAALCEATAMMLPVCDLHRTCTRCLAEAQEAKA